MSVLAYLQRCATETLVDERERQRIDRSIRNLQDKLVAHFDSAIQDHFWVFRPIVTADSGRS